MKRLAVVLLLSLATSEPAFGDTLELLPVGGSGDVRFLDGTLQVGDISLSTVSNNELVLGTGDFVRLSDTGGLKLSSGGLILGQDGVGTLEAETTAKFIASRANTKTQLIIEPSGTPSTNEFAVLSINLKGGSNEERFHIIANGGLHEYQISQYRSGTGAYYPLTFYGGSNGSSKLLSEVFRITAPTSGDPYTQFSRAVVMNNGVDLNFRNSFGTPNSVVRVDASNDIYVGDLWNNFTGSLHLRTSGATRLSIASTGNVGIGTASPINKLQVAGDIRVGTGTNGCVWDAGNNIIAGACSSDRRLKSDIRPFANMLEEVSELQPVYFHWRSTNYPNYNSGPEESFGLVAQDVEQHLPELVTEDERGMKAVRYNELPLVMLQAIKELKAITDSLSRENSELKARLSQLELSCTSQH